MTTNGRKERPILFSGPMVRAILEGRKTQTRRVVVFLPEYPRAEFVRVKSDGRISKYDPVLSIAHADAYAACPYGKVGDRLWVRETHGIFSVDAGTASVGYKARLPVGKTLADTDGGLDVIRVDETANRWAYTHIDNERWRPSIFMPRWASRLTLEITDVRVERLQDIGCQDVMAEGSPVPMREYSNPELGLQCVSAKEWLQEGWDKLNAKRGYSWASNPWVWVLGFQRMGSTQPNH